MHKILILLLFVIILTHWFTGITFAISNPLEVPNNRYGIHIIDENDLDNAAVLVNSSGGDWGYVTIVIPENERKTDKWNAIFDRMRILHLIPIIRIASSVKDGVWKAPTSEDIPLWIEFLSSLSWVSKNRYVILFNEPNHAKEWGGKLDPGGYAILTASLSAQLKASSEDFFILPAALDASAPNSPATMDEKLFLRDVLAVVPDYFDRFDGWNSHSYPNPGFSGKVASSGRGTLRTFLWEKEVLKQLGITKTFPVFITETGWAHAEGTRFDGRFYSAVSLSDLIDRASRTIWMDNSIVALTPFILNYQGDPFSNFSWQKLGENNFYPQFDTYRLIPKVRGMPLFIPTPTPVLPTLTPTPIPIPDTVVSNIGHIFRYFFSFYIKARS